MPYHYERFRLPSSSRVSLAQLEATLLTMWQLQFKIGLVLLERSVYFGVPCLAGTKNTATGTCVMLSVLVADRNDLISAGIAALLRGAGHEVVQAGAAEEVLRAVNARELDLAVLCEEFFNETEQDLWSTIKKVQPVLRVILLLKGLAKVPIRDADGIILKDATADQLLACVDSVSAGHRWADPILLNWFIQGVAARSPDPRLTPRETVIASLIARGMRNKQIAREMKVSEATVKMHLHHIYDKLHLNGRTELALRARDLHMAAASESD